MMRLRRPRGMKNNAPKEPSLTPAQVKEKITNAERLVRIETKLDENLKNHGSRITRLENWFVGLAVLVFGGAITVGFAGCG